jgi:hypothetical protein
MPEKYLIVSCPVKLQPKVRKLVENSGGGHRMMQLFWKTADGPEPAVDWKEKWLDRVIKILNNDQDLTPVGVLGEGNGCQWERQTLRAERNFDDFHAHNFDWFKENLY